MNNLEELNSSELWQRYKEERDWRARELLIEAYAPLVKYVAGRLAMHMPRNIELDDLESYGVFGLLDAIEKYDPDREIKFETYASTRIRGAIIDGLRSSDWVPRSVRSKARVLENKIQELTQGLGRTPADEEVAAALDIPMPRYYDMLDEVRGTALISLEETAAGENTDEQIRVVDMVADRQEGIDQELLHTESLSELTAAVDQLTEREQLVLSLYYHDELTLKEIGHVLGVSESRVSQIHTKAIITLRSTLQWF